jgi:dipeptidyl aminopeptidase/acylaminoacyl peptidase
MRPRILHWLAAMAGTMVVLMPGSGAANPVAGDQVAYVAAGEIRLRAVNGSGFRTLARGESPSWSPDGRAIAFQSARVPGNGLDIYLMSADGTDQRRVVNHPGGGGEHPINTADDFAPAWSPAFWGIAFTTKRDGNEEIYSMDPIGHRVQRLTNSPAADRDPAWSPDAGFIAFVSDRDGNDEIYTLSARRELLRLTRDPAADQAPAWSPDGRHLVFESFRDGNWELYSVTDDGTNLRRLTENPAADQNPAYSPDGTTIAFTSDRDRGRGLFVMDAAGGPARRLTASVESADHAAWRPGVDLALRLRRLEAVRRGRLARFELEVVNRTSTPAFAVAVTGRIPRGIRLVAARAPGGRCLARTISCSFARLAAGQSARIQLSVRPRRCGRRTLSISAASRQMDRSPGDNRRRLAFRIGC